MKDKRQATGSDAKKIFIKHFNRMIESDLIVPKKGHDSNGYSNVDDFRLNFIPDKEADSAFMRSTIEFMCEFMSEFNLGVAERRGEFFIERTGAIGRPSTRKKKISMANRDRELHEAHAQAVIEQNDSERRKREDDFNESLEINERAVDGKIGTQVDKKPENMESMFGECPNCGNNCIHNPVNSKVLKCSMCDMVHSPDEIKV